MPGPGGVGVPGPRVGGPCSRGVPGPGGVPAPVGGPGRDPRLGRPPLRAVRILLECILVGLWIFSPWTDVVEVQSMLSYE